MKTAERTPTPPTKTETINEAYSKLTFGLAGIFKDSLTTPTFATREEQLNHLKTMEGHLQRYSDGLLPHFFALLDNGWNYDRLADILAIDAVSEPACVVWKAW
eukprot:4816058-Heterocapsa_arctica.AAC.1